jgi:hypothetical protein
LWILLAIEKLVPDEDDNMKPVNTSGLGHDLYLTATLVATFKRKSVLEKRKLSQTRWKHSSPPRDPPGTSLANSCGAPHKCESKRQCHPTSFKDDGPSRKSCLSSSRQLVLFLFHEATNQPPTNHDFQSTRYVVFEAFGIRISSGRRWSSIISTK